MWNIVLYVIALICLLLSLSKDKNKTKMALKKAWKAFENIMPEFLGIIVLVGILMALLNPELISKLIGERSGWLGVVLSAAVGAITLIPGFVAFPTAAMLLEHGAGYMQIGAFVSALMMVGVITFPVEMKYFGRQLTIARNGLAFIFCFVVAYVIGKVVGGI